MNWIGRRASEGRGIWSGGDGWQCRETWGKSSYPAKDCVYD